MLIYASIILNIDNLGWKGRVHERGNKSTPYVLYPIHTDKNYLYTKNIISL